MEIDYVTCPKCKCKYWVDIPNPADKNRCKYRCSRCGYTMVLGACAKCRTPKPWIQIQGIDEKGGRYPVYRYQCKTCQRIIGVLIDKL